MSPQSGKPTALVKRRWHTVQGYIRERMQAGYDAEYLRQIFDFIVYIISCMEAPARRESTQKVWPSQKYPHPTSLEGLIFSGCKLPLVWIVLRAIAHARCRLRREHPCEPSREPGFQVQQLPCRVMRRC